MSTIFLSHSSRDNFEVVALRDWLAREGWTTQWKQDLAWFDARIAALGK